MQDDPRSGGHLNAEAGMMCGRLLAKALLVQRTAAASPPRQANRGVIRQPLSQASRTATATGLNLRVRNKYTGP
jgi:hypothetical protein